MVKPHGFASILNLWLNHERVEVNPLVSWVVLYNLLQPVCHFDGDAMVFLQDI